LLLHRSIRCRRRQRWIAGQAARGRPARRTGWSA